MSKTVVIVIGVLTAIGIGVASFIVLTPDEDSSLSSVDCNETVPAFTYLPTDLERITQITPPLMRVSGDVKTHSYIDVLERAPIFAPVDAKLTGGAKYEASRRGLSEQYTLNFEVGCGISFYIDHLIDPIALIAEEFPGPVQEDTHGQLVSSVEVKAGQLIGYSAGSGRHNWDFGVLDSRQETILADEPEFNWSDKYRHAVCPYSFYDEPTQKAVAKLYSYDNHSDLQVIDNLCEPSS